MSHARRLTIAFGIAVALLVAVFIGLQTVRIVEPLGVDQGLFVCFSRWVPRGWLPYRDLFDSKPPLFLYTYGIAGLIPGDVTRAAWLLEAVWLAGILGLAYALAARLWGRWAGLATSALLFAGLWHPAWGGFWSRAQAEEFLTLPMIGSAWAAWAARERTGLAFWAGVLAGVCGLYKVPSMAIAGAWMVLWLGSLRWRASVRRVGWMAIGIAAPWMLTAGWFAAHGAFGAFVEGVFVYHRYNAAFIAPPWIEVLEDFTFQLVTGAALPLAAGTLGATLLIVRGAREAWWIVPWAGMTMAAIVLQRQLSGYHYLLAMPGLAFAGGYAVAETARVLRRGPARTRALCAAGLTILVGLLVRDALAYRRAYSPDLAYGLGHVSRQAYLRAIQLGSYSMATEEAAAEYVKARTTPDQGVLVWGLSPGLYALADRHPVTRFPFHKLLMTDAPLSRMWPGLAERRAAFMRQLHDDPPAYVLVGRGDRNGFEPEESYSSMMRFTALRDFVERNYHQESDVGHFVVFRRRAAPATGSIP